MNFNSSFAYLKSVPCLRPSDHRESVPGVFISCHSTQMGRQFNAGWHGAEVMDVMRFDRLWISVRRNNTHD